jgi:hypothetical protein
MTFHDRLYIVKNMKNKYKGVFGPSMNGLGSHDIVLMGELEDKTIGDLLNLGLDK